MNHPLLQPNVVRLIQILAEEQGYKLTTEEVMAVIKAMIDMQQRLMAMKGPQ